MPLDVFLAVLVAAFLHAAWNAVIKTGGDKIAVMLIMTLVQGGLGLAIALTRPLPGPEVWGWLLASGVFHSLYKLALASAYERGDLSRVYPIARGAAPVLVLGIGAVALSDVITGLEAAAVVVLGCGILLMARGIFSLGENRALLPFALGSALATAGYSLVDGMGARVSGDAVGYVAWLFVLDAVFFAPVVLALRGRSLLAGPGRQDWLKGGVAALASYGAYAIAVWGMTRAPIALVAALRETSILFAVLIGWLVFGERMDRMKLLAAGLIVTGVVLMRV
ncbi:putative integral membrane protein DUF6 [Dinoroseobacter shibae DFL 12 = DSM 16493]|jgi:drug/metabolite transporter (DMT)-like permease|uniref:Putative integral membrane protein DUF6 n=1 Tax=Dinoroseobacter shibae (strain DSM 16493 / NCIMB 14021 / DFL 12) TaxID=398580 RepID=A8LNY9_DINSH|nr:DMT family transporter [Dinoroseobacter shibae]ABV93671.1 putative integral membrane protein DUF6 [Dinoroseobacter shibae DFL 12 = DSM 16493]URF45124.1 DMT family transporter [Dinoroseobacter shibae]URF49429.1 DMT family transporter [Dinoroseobacter shibae]